MAQGVQEFITLEDTRAQQSTFEGRLAMNALPRGRKNFPMVREFVHFRFVVGPLDPALDDEFLLKDFSLKEPEFCLAFPFMGVIKRLAKPWVHLFRVSNCFGKVRKGN